jgi:hypothetical protein
MEKTISVRRTTITFSIWDLGGQREFVNMLPLVCNDAVAILFMFDLSRKSTLNSVKEWYRQARGFNKVCFCSNRLWHPLTNFFFAPIDSDPVPHRNKVRHVRDIPPRRARGDHKASETIRKGNARLTHLLFYIGLDQCPEDIQNRPCKSIRSQMCHPRNRGRWRACTYLRRCLTKRSAPIPRMPFFYFARIGSVFSWISAVGRLRTFGGQ